MKRCETTENSRIITIAGCKGGVGKSVISSALAIEAGRRGVDVILVDADLGGPNLHTYLGIRRPERVMSDFLSHRIAEIEETILDTELPGVRLISCAGNIPSQANLKFTQKMKIIKAISSLRAELLIVDIGAGSSRDVMDFFSMTDGGILVTTSEPASIINSYGFMKNVVYRWFERAFRAREHLAELLERGMNPETDDGIPDMQEFLDVLSRLDTECWIEAKGMLSKFCPGIIINRAESAGETAAGETAAGEAGVGEAGVGEKLKAIVKKYLSIEAECLGTIVEDLYVKAAARKMTPFSVLAPDCPAAQSVRRIAVRLLDRSPSEAPIESMMG